jgi:hypothetical protein
MNEHSFDGTTLLAITSFAVYSRGLDETGFYAEITVLGVVGMR